MRGIVVTLSPSLHKFRWCWCGATSSTHTNPPTLTHTLQYQTEWSLIMCLAETISDWSVPGDELLHSGNTFKCTIPRSGSHWRPLYDWNTVATTKHTATYWTVDWQLRVFTEEKYNYILLRDNQCQRLQEWKGTTCACMPWSKSS